MLAYGSTLVYSTLDIQVITHLPSFLFSMNLVYPKILLDAVDTQTQNPEVSDTLLLLALLQFLSTSSSEIAP